MAGVKWIKITTNMFDDEKIDFIQGLPEGDSILIIWIRLLTMAGKCNAGGYVFLTENIPYTTETLSYKFKKSANIIKLALETFERLGMIQNSEKGLYISNFAKYQNMEGLEKLKQREYERLKKQKQREKAKELPSNTGANVNVPGTFPGHSPGTPSTVDIEREKDIDIDIDKDIERELEAEKKESPNLNSQAFELCKYYEMLKPGQSIAAHLTTLEIWIDMYSFEWTKEALQKCVSSTGKFIKPWIEKVLKGWVIERKEGQNGTAEQHQATTTDPNREGIGIEI